MSQSKFYVNEASQLNHEVEDVFQKYYQEITHDIYITEKSQNKLKKLQEEKSSLKKPIELSQESKFSLPNDNDLDDLDLLLDSLISQSSGIKNPNTSNDKFRDAIGFISKYESLCK